MVMDHAGSSITAASSQFDLLVGDLQKYQDILGQTKGQ